MVDEETKYTIFGKVNDYLSELKIFDKLKEKNFPIPYFDDVQYFGDIKPGFYVVQLWSDIKGQKREVGFVTLDENMEIEKKPLDDTLDTQIKNNYHEQKKKIDDLEYDKAAKKIVKDYDEYRYNIQKFFIYEYKDLYVNFRSELNNQTLDSVIVDKFLDTMRESLKVLPKESIMFTPWETAYLDIFPEILVNYIDKDISCDSKRVIDVGISFLNCDLDSISLNKQYFKRKESGEQNIFTEPIVVKYTMGNDTIIEKMDMICEGDKDLIKKRNDIERIIEENKNILQSLE